MIRFAIIGGTANAVVSEGIRQAAEQLAGILSSRGAKIFSCGSARGVIGHFLDSFQNVRELHTAVVLSGFEERHIHSSVESHLLLETAAQRKDSFLARVDALVALPGGFGTHDEIFAFASVRKPVLLVNPNDFFAPLLNQIACMKREQFISEAQEQLVLSARNGLELEASIAKMCDAAEGAGARR